MSSDIFSEDERGPPAVERLLKENKMKELALKKATNIIELLNIELEVERNTSQENLRMLEQELKMQHQQQLRQMEQKMEGLQMQLKRKSQTSIDYDRTIRKTALNRAYSSKSAVNIRRRATSKKHTETQPFQEVPQPMPQIQVSLELYRQQAVDFEVWKQALIQQLDQVVKGEYDELEVLINRIDEGSEECRGLGSSRPTHINMHSSLSDVIRKQNNLINALLSYAQQLQDLCKSINSQLSSLLSTQKFSFVEFSPLQLAEIKKNILKTLSFREQKLRRERNGLEGENHQLKNILESFIDIVKLGKKPK